MVGGVALLVAAAGAVTAGSAVSANGEDTTPAASNPEGGYVAKASATPLAGRDATRVSRSGLRPTLNQDPALADAAERQADERSEKLRDAARLAEQYAEELDSDEWVLPVQGARISVRFGEAGGYWSSGYHTGIDFAVGYGTPVVAVQNAEVVQTGWDGPYGNQVRLRLENGDEVWYNHLSSIDVAPGQAVTKGQQLGRVGDTGNAYGYHLHFEYRLAANLHDGVDPAPFFAAHGIPL